MNAFELLGPVSWAAIVLAVVTVVVPYIRGKSDLLTTWNFFLLGTICYIGLSGLEAYWEPSYFNALREGQYSQSDYRNYLWGVVTFFAAAYTGYYLIKLPRAAADRFPRKWPPATTSVLVCTLPLMMILAVGAVYPPQIIFINKIFLQIGNKALIVTLVLAFVAWYRQKMNPVLLIVLAIVVAFGSVFAVMQGGGRRTIVNLFVAIPLCIYWLRLRYRSPWLNLSLACIFGLVTIAAVAGYSQIRHFDRQGERRERNFANSLWALRQVPQHLNRIEWGEFTGQHAVQYSLGAIHLYTTDKDPDPFNSLLFVLTNPMPRELWENKPEPLGYTLPLDLNAIQTRANWGAGIVGHGFHEGGLHMVAFYSILIGMVFRYFDELLVRQAGNPYLLAAFAAMASHVFGWTRGDMGTFNIQIIGSCIIALVLSWAGRMLFGTGIVYPRTGSAPARPPQAMYGSPYAAPSA